MPMPECRECGRNDIVGENDDGPYCVRHQPHHVYVLRTITSSTRVTATADGHARLGDDEQIVDHVGSYLVCDDCGPLGNPNRLRAHGFSPDWEEQ